MVVRSLSHTPHAAGPLRRVHVTDKTAKTMPFRKEQKFYKSRKRSVTVLDKESTKAVAVS